jgi:acyl transferase domain-containing protein
MSPTGRCRTFDADADGYVRGEGCGVVTLKRLSDATRDGDSILAVIRSSAVNHDGRSNGLTAPNGMAQREVIRRALDFAGIDPLSIGYVEAHGTGTALGDPIEVEALASVLCANRSAGNPLVIGSVKTNVGHLEAAAGMSGLIKLILMMQREEIPPHLNFSKPSPHIPWKELPLEVPVQGRRWARSEYPRRAGLSSFGFAGTNAHIIVEEAPSAPAASDEPSGAQILAISAKDHSALKDLTKSFADFLSDSQDSLADIAFTANTGRSHFACRLAVSARTKNEARERILKAIESGVLNQDGDETIARYLAGETIDWAALYRGTTYRKVQLPTYAFQRQRYWREFETRRPDTVEPSHPVLGKRLRSALADSPTFNSKSRSGQILIHC